MRFQGGSVMMYERGDGVAILGKAEEAVLVVDTSQVSLSEHFGGDADLETDVRVACEVLVTTGRGMSSCGQCGIFVRSFQSAASGELESY